jgi:hypothetical protein
VHVYGQERGHETSRTCCVHQAGGIVSASRPFIDSFGFSWQACELRPEESPPREAGRGVNEARGRLYFFCRGTTRVLEHYPGDWHRGSWAELEDLCARAALLGADLGAIATSADVERLSSGPSAAAR